MATKPPTRQESKTISFLEIEIVTSSTHHQNNIFCHNYKYDILSPTMEVPTNGGTQQSMVSKGKSHLEDDN